MVFKKGKAVNGSFLFIKSFDSDLDYPRFGFVVAAKFAPKAVVRNKVRRMLTQSIWPELLPNMSSCDTVVVVTKKIPEKIELVKDDFLTTLKRSKIL